MKRIILLIAIIGFTFGAQAQKKNSKMEAKVKSTAEYITQKMNLDESKSAFLYETILANAKLASQKKKAVSTKEEKKAINKEMRKKLKKELKAQFTEEEVNQIFALMKEKRELDKQQK